MDMNRAGPMPPERPREPPKLTKIIVTYPPDMETEEETFTAQGVSVQHPFVMVIGIDGNPLNRTFIRAELVERVEQREVNHS